MNGLQPRDQSDSQERTKVEDKIFWKGRFLAQSETVMEGENPSNPKNDSVTVTTET